ncbi:hypothetical protein B0H19DRAFT_1150848 [Mycena capillaripes]|nr:hypothetical protein B0H19DRAFT_1150848 [Mycena capillaripes]
MKTTNNQVPTPFSARRSYLHSGFLISIAVGILLFYPTFTSFPVTLFSLIVFLARVIMCAMTIGGFRKLPGGLLFW